MKAAIILALVLGAQYASARVHDFNAMIRENNQAQAELQGKLEKTVESARVAQEKRQDGYTVVEMKPSVHAVPTKKSVLRFKKEKVRHQLDQKAEANRLANELRSLEN